ncbi:MAG TPA: hypothetical protein VGQ41_06895 [Pyrinomonadaceae bacterium]|jgi:hypothetical protein|nr:hypothetical protein [Pyrinomonadaceae bacterium]
MSLKLESLNDNVRVFMAQEVEFDVTNDQLYKSKYFNNRGESAYLDLIREAARAYDDGWLADRLRAGGCMNSKAMRRKPKGGYTEVSVPVTAPDTFAEGEFNRFYARGLCLYAIEMGIPSLLVYRAKAVMVPRADSEAMIGRLIEANALLQDLRTHQGVDTALGLPNGPNSGLSVRLPE